MKIPSLLAVTALFLAGPSLHAVKPLSPPPVLPAPTQTPPLGTAPVKTPSKQSAAPSDASTPVRKAPAPKSGATSELSPEILAKRMTPKEREAQVRVQIFLDAALFTPGKIDGLPGEFTDKAVQRYQKAKGLAVTGRPDNLPLQADLDPFTEYTIRSEDKKFVGGLSSNHEQQARMQYLPYRSYFDFLTERFHCSESLIQYLNPSLNLEKLKVGDTVKVPAVEPFRIEDMKSAANLPERPEFKQRRLQIDRKERILEVFEQDSLIASVPITPGSSALPTPPGKWRIYGISTMPTFRWDEGVLNHGVRTNQFFMLPPGPRNPVGVVWCALNKPGIGIHGTNQPQTIGRAQSHGCMRVANWDVVRLIEKITTGIPVIIE